MTPPFTYEECYRAFSRFLDEDSATELARSCVSATPEAGGRLHTDGDLRFSSVSNTQLTEDTLILLSLESPELDAKVRAYRVAFRLGVPESPEEVAEWARRRTELKAWADAGYPTEK